MKNTQEAMEMPLDTNFTLNGLSGNGFNHNLNVKWITIARTDANGKLFNKDQFESRKLSVYQFYRHAIMYRVRAENGYLLEDILMEVSNG